MLAAAADRSLLSTAHQLKGRPMTASPRIDPIDLRDLVGDVLDVDPDAITEDVHFIRDLGVDSLLALELAVTLERQYGVKIESHEMAEIETMTDVRALLQSKIPSRG
jgi:acyl carrier protein